MIEQQQFEKHVENLLDNGYTFSIGEYISRGYEIYKREKGLYIGCVVVYLLIVIFLGSIPYVGFILNQFIVAPALIAGFYLISNRISTDKQTEFGNFFDGFQRNLPQLILTVIVSFIISLLVMLPSIYQLYNSGIFEWYMEVINNPFDLGRELPDIPSNLYTVIGLNVIPLIYLTIAYMWAVPLVIFYDLNFWDALETSRKVITKQWFSVFLLMLAMVGLFFLFGMLLGMAAIIPFIGVVIAFIGIIFIVFAGIAIMNTVNYAAFADVFQLEKETEEPDILDHLIE